MMSLKQIAGNSLGLLLSLPAGLSSPITLKARRARVFVRPRLGRGHSREYSLNQSPWWRAGTRMTRRRSAVGANKRLEGNTAVNEGARSIEKSKHRREERL